MQVWASGYESRDNLTAFRDAFSLELPILRDEKQLVNSTYDQAFPFATGAYPQEWIIGTDGKIAYAANRFEYDAVIEVLERELTE
ncbi:MAG: peroxiredoxin [Myxococcota bacterium]